MSFVPGTPHRRTKSILKYSRSLAYAVFSGAVFTSAQFKKDPKNFGICWFSSKSFTCAENKHNPNQNKHKPNHNKHDLNHNKHLPNQNKHKPNHNSHEEKWNFPLKNAFEVWSSRLFVVKSFCLRLQMRFFKGYSTMHEMRRNVRPWCHYFP